MWQPGGANASANANGERTRRRDAATGDRQEVLQIILIGPNKMIGQTFIRNIWELNIDEFQHQMDLFYILVCHMLIRSILGLQKKSVKMPDR